MQCINISSEPLSTVTLGKYLPSRFINNNSLIQSRNNSSMLFNVWLERALNAHIKRMEDERWKSDGTEIFYNVRWYLNVFSIHNKSDMYRRKWEGHLGRITGKRFPKQALTYVPICKWERGRPRECCEWNNDDANDMLCYDTICYKSSLRSIIFTT